MAGYTIKDIAKETGLSVATISKYLNGKPILPENQAKIRQSIQKSGYSPNKNAQLLRGNKTKVAAILTSYIGDYFWGTIFSYISEYMQAYGYATIIITYQPWKTDYSETMRQLEESGAGSVFLVPNIPESPCLKNLLRHFSCPMIYIDQVSAEPPADAVTSNNRESAYLLTEYLIRHGHRRIAVIGGRGTSYTTIERIKGYSDACDTYHIPLSDRLIYCKSFASNSAAFSFQEINKLPVPPTALMILGYNLAISVLVQLRKAGLSIPDDFSVVTFDDDEVFPALSRPITVMVQDLKGIAEHAVRLMMLRLSGDQTDFPKIDMIPAHLIERSSVRNI